MHYVYQLVRGLWWWNYQGEEWEGGGGKGDEGREHDTVSGTARLLEVKLSRKLLFSFKC